MTSLRTQLCILAIALSGCGLDYHDNQSCVSGYDCLDGYTCSFNHVCEMPPEPPDFAPFKSRVREGATTRFSIPRDSSGYYPVGNFHMQYGTLERPYYDPFVDDPITGVLDYSALEGQFDHEYVDTGSIDVQYTIDLSVTVPVEVTVTLDKPPALPQSVIEVQWNTAKNFFLYPVDSDSTEVSQYTIQTQPSHGVVTAVTDDHGPTGELSYVPAAGYFGPDSFDVTLSDGIRSAVSTVTLDVTCGHAIADETTTTWFDASPIDVAHNDTITGTTLEIATAPMNGTATVYNGAVVYHATHGFVGDDTFTYRASRTEGCSATGTVTVHVTNPVERLASGDYNRDGALSKNGNVVAYVGQGLTQDDVVWVSTGGTNPVSVKNRFGDEPGAATRRPHLSGDGRYLVFDTQATDMVANPSVSALGDVYMLDRMTGTVELISVGASGGGNNESYGAQVSDDGRYVSFVSVATDLVPGDTNGVSDVFVRDRQTGTTELVSVSSSGARATTGAGRQARMSASGRIVAFTGDSVAFGADGGGDLDLLVRDRTAGTTVLAAQGNGDDVVLSRNGRYVAGHGVIYDAAAGTTQQEPFATSITDDGAYFVRDPFIFDRESGAMQDVCKDVLGRLPPNIPCEDLLVSGDGHTVLFTSRYELRNTSPTNVFASGQPSLYRIRR